MTSLAEIRQKYPQYKDIPDQDLVDGLYNKYYSSMPKEQFYNTVGYKPAVEPSMLDKLGRQVGLTGRYLLEGGEAALTTPVRATAEAISGGLNLAGKKDAADYISRTLGMKGNGGTVIADSLGLPTPEGKLERGVAGASKMVAGLGAGGVVNKLAAESPQVVQGAVNALMPGANSAGEAAIASGIGAGMEVAPGATASTLLTLGALRGGKAAYNGVADWRAEKKLFGNTANPEADAQVILDLAKLKQDPGRWQQIINDQAAVGRSNATGIGTDYKNKVKSLMDQGGIADPNLELLMKKKNVTTDDITNLMNGSPEEKATAAALLLGQRADAMTKPGVSNSLMSIPRAAVKLALPEWLANPINATLGGRTTGEANINKLTSDRAVSAAERILSKNASPVNDINQFETSVNQGILSKAAAEEAAAQKAAQEAAAAEGALKDANIAGMRINRAPAGGAFQMLRQHTGLSDEDIVSSLRQLKGDEKLSKYIEQIRQGGNTDDGAIFAVQNAIMGLQKKLNKGILNEATPGALYEGQNVTVSGIRNPVSYAANVKNAEEAVKLARDSAFSPELGQFATTVAGTKSPADKLALVQDRLANATDPAEIDFINKFVLPLANFGKK